ncbi:MAG TPA: LacI family DNA-binding transcriptional regulator [Solirubrobacteraceae bacterium]|nr:LacI family DNA-binding transcriptional regulator [Solirubrobacteraceae bacterium]
MESPRDSTDGRRVPPSARRPTMREVAALAEVSLSTVSRVVNGSPPVAPELARRVEQAVAILGYRHDQIAGSLRRANRASATVGLVFEDVANPFFSLIHRAVEDVAAPRSVLTLAGSSDEDPVRERELTEGLLARRVDGLIVVPTPGDHSFLERDVAAGVALVFVDRPPEGVDADSVVSANFEGARAAVSHLIAQGHRRIGFVGDQPDIYTAAERLRGFRAALAEHGIAEDPDLIGHPSFRATDAEAVTAQLLESAAPPTALFSAQNLITVGAMRTVHRLGLQRSIAFVGFDDLPLADVLDPGITVVEQDAYGIGRQAAELMFSRMDGYHGPSRHVTLATPLIQRGSGEIPPP